jgi:hypothetical protein
VTRRLAYVLLVVALVSSGGTAPFAHVHAHGDVHDATQPDEAQAHGHTEHHTDQGAHWHLTTRRAAAPPDTTAVVGMRYHHTQVAVATVAIERPGVRVGSTPALSEAWQVGIVPVLPGRPVPIDANARPNPPPRIVLAARAPPI